ncbi:MAG: acyltransferase family protein [Pseudonocardia sp.]
MVVVHHVFLTQPVLAAPYLDPTAVDVGDVSWWAAYTPLHLLWAGTEAVFVFFVLSGLVLALPVAGSGRVNPWDYFPRRLLRLYLPVWAAVTLAVLWATAFPRTWQVGDSWWLSQHAENPTVPGAVGDLFLLWWPGSTNHVLWSLQWEVLFCLALPLFLVMARTCRTLWHVKALVLLLMLVIGAGIDSPALASLPLFALGTLMAVEHRRLASWAASVHRRRRPQLWWSAALVVCVGLLMSYWFVHAFGTHVAEETVAATRGLQALGACLVVFLVWHWPGARRFMTSSVMQWLGTRSFSLYLVHLPIVVSVAVALGGKPALGSALVLTVIITFPLTEIFYRLVERPSHRIARRVGQSSAARAAGARSDGARSDGARAAGARSAGARSDDKAGGRPSSDAPWNDPDQVLRTRPPSPDCPSQYSGAA